MLEKLFKGRSSCTTERFLIWSFQATWPLGLDWEKGEKWKILWKAWKVGIEPKSLRICPGNGCLKGKFSWNKRCACRCKWRGQWKWEVLGATRTRREVPMDVRTFRALWYRLRILVIQQRIRPQGPFFFLGWKIPWVLCRYINITEIKRNCLGKKKL